MHKTTVYLPEDVQQSLNEAARRTGRREAAIVRDALAAYLQDQPRRWPSSIGAGEDEEFAARDSKAWLRENWHPK